jgi:hypothetical protein
MSPFVRIARELFSFLEHEYGFLLDHYREEPWGSELVYINPARGVGIRIVDEASFACTFVFIHRLIDRELLRNPSPITDESQINCIDLNDVLNESDKMKPAYEYGESSIYYDEKNGLRNYISEFAQRLKQYGNDILKGNLETAFRKAGPLIKGRARQSM